MLIMLAEGTEQKGVKNETFSKCTPPRGLANLLCPFNVINGQWQRHLKKTFILYSVSYIETFLVSQVFSKHKTYVL